MATAEFAGMSSAALSQPSNQGRPHVGEEGKCKPAAGPKSLIGSAERLLTSGELWHLFTSVWLSLKPLNV